jgi:hypothetical protein
MRVVFLAGDLTADLLTLVSSGKPEVVLRLSNDRWLSVLLLAGELLQRLKLLFELHCSNMQKDSTVLQKLGAVFRNSWFLLCCFSTELLRSKDGRLKDRE